MMRYCSEIGLRIFVMDRSQCRRSSEYYASSIYEDDILSRVTLTVMVRVSVMVSVRNSVKKCRCE